MKGESGRKIAARSAFSKSSLYRHRDKCLPKSIVSRHRDRVMTAQTPGRIVVQWPPDYDGPSLTTVKRGNTVPFDPKDFGENDALIVVTFETTPLDEIGNPGALVTPNLIGEALREDAERFPIADLSDSAECKRVDEGPKD
jgi:hypothetical protein